MAKEEREVDQLRARLEDAEETLRAIRSGEVDALVVEGTDGDQVYTLRGADHTYRLLLQEMNEGAATLMPDGTVLYCNARFAAIMGRPLEKIIGYILSDLVEPASRTALDALLRSGTHVRVKEEITFAAPNGRVPVYCSVGPLELDGLSCLSLVATDLTAQKRSEEILASEMLARHILDRAVDVIVVCNEKGSISHASRAAHALAGTNVLHRQFETVFPFTLKDGESMSRSVVSDGSAENDSFAASLGSRTVQGVEVEFVRGDGRKFDLLMSAGPLRNAKEQSRGCVFTLTDITRLKEAEEGLRQSQAQLSAELTAMSRLHQASTELFAARDLRTALDEILDATIAMQGADFGNVQLYNRESRCLEIVAQRGFSRDFLDFFCSVRADDDSACGRALRDGKRIVIEDIEADAAYVPYRPLAAAAGYRAVQSTPLLSRDGEVLGMLSTHFRVPHRPSDREIRMLDLYARQAADFIVHLRAEEALRSSEEKLRRQAEELEQQLIASGRLVSLGEITASMAHEFNNPLGIVIGFAEDLLTEKQPSDPDHQALRIIHEESKRCQKIIQDLLEYSRPRRVEMRPIGVQELVENSLQLITNRLYKRKVVSAVEFEPTLPQIHADPQQIEQVLVNLYLNAMDAMPDGGRLAVSVRRHSNEMLAITVTDSGMGIGAEDLPKIFQPFFSVKKKSGLGLGLPICRRIIKNHGGKIEVKSRLAQGTSFEICLPIEQKSIDKDTSLSRQSAESDEERV